ncbi:SPW repeat domain-containing protein [Mycolicibacter sinensis]|uniref:SPW repeat-containing integral membrane domain-containing protein n=1 Tax=Mycolicibacter sinensis (strain JDM601) TaxID=875328 RepID=A0A1A2Y374_MYCSD|nr:SPW repeat protein [Mycolicibacter sinensis]OBH16145.1 hypothetical protein A5694_07345 [Mycolicibacter sinensis]OBI31762.1 hypothetical protein A5710_16820 [Mycolicibacter sinensis]
MNKIRWMDWTNLALGLYLLCVPLFTANSGNGSTIWVAEVGGATILLLAIWALAAPSQSTAEWAQSIVGVCVLVSPFAFSYAELSGAAWNAYTVGAAVAALALTGLPAVKRNRSSARTPERVRS